MRALTQRVLVALALAAARLAIWRLEVMVVVS